MPPSSVTLDPDDPFDSILIDMVRINRAKRNDYAGQDWWTQNFIDSAYMTNTTPGHSCEILIGTKQSRLRTLLKPAVKAKNESIEDTIMDRAVYSVIAVGIYREGGYNRDAELGCGETIE